jgi:cyclo(L-tyrosyl-L-tyrosyl) synthase
LVLTWEQVAANARYQSLLEEATEVYEKDADFRQDCQEAARSVLERRLANHAAAIDWNLDLAAEYFLSEMPLFVDSPAILQTEASVFAYHHCPPLLEKLYRGRYRYCVTDRQGFVVVTCPGDGEVEEGMLI